MATNNSLDGLVPVKCSFKGPHLIKIGNTRPNGFVANGCKLLTLSFLDSASVDIAAITFTNKFTGLITITGKYKIATENTGESFKFVWKRIVVSKKLMPNPHFTSGAESSFIIRSSEFLADAKGVSSIKILLQQPSVHYTDFGIENLKLYCEDPSENSNTLPSWLTSSESKSTHSVALKGLPPVDQISQLLQSMWALGKKAENLKQKEKVNVDRFDKDGCYDISLLAYE